VQLAAAELKREEGGPAVARLASRARRLLAGLPDRLLGVRVPELAAAARALETGTGPVRIPLAWSIP
jgi:hypothetical protein